MELQNLILKLQGIELWQNTLYQWLVALLIFLSFILVLKIFQLIILGRLKKLTKATKTDFDDALIAIFSKIKPPFYFFVALFFSVKYLNLPEVLIKVLGIIILIAVVYEVVQSISRFVDYFIDKYLQKDSDPKIEKKYSQSMLKALSMIVKGCLWVVAIILILSNLGINVTSLIASLGIGGIAIALALQNILTDMFSSFSIYVDKPFQIGDFITCGADSGTVERIGLKTTRIRTLQGEELIVSNRELTTARVQNFKTLEKRREVTKLSVEYTTSHSKLATIPQICQQLVESIKGLEFNRCHFANYGESSLDFELVYFIPSNDYVEYMNKKQAVNMAIFEAFKKQEIEFAFPTQTINVKK